jgi:hypothetical protein
MRSTSLSPGYFNRASQNEAAGGQFAVRIESHELLAKDNIPQLGQILQEVSAIEKGYVVPPGASWPWHFV